MIKNIWKSIPENKVKKRLRCFIHNCFLKIKRINARIVYKENFYVTNIYLNKKKVSFKTLEDPYPDIIPCLGYLKEYLPKKGDYIIDGGSYAGVFSLIVSEIIGKRGKILALEPDRLNYSNLVKNIRMNNKKNIETINIALWNKRSVLSFKERGDEGSMIDFNKKEKDKVKTTTIDNLILDKKLKRIDFIKMDIEGSEIEAVQGASKTIKEYSPYFAIASYHLRDGKETSDYLERFFREKGYFVFTSFHDHKTTYAFPTIKKTKKKKVNFKKRKSKSL